MNRNNYSIALTYTEKVNMEIQDLIQNIEVVLFDIEGTLYRGKGLFPKSEYLLNKLRELGKKVCFISNNSELTADRLERRFKSLGISNHELITPNLALTTYLRKKCFKKDIFAICGVFCRKRLENDGYNVIQYKDFYDENINTMEDKLGTVLLDTVWKVVNKCENVGLVYIDFDINLHYLDIQIVQVLLNRFPDVELICGQADDLSMALPEMPIVCPKFLVEGLERWTNKTATLMCKPGSFVAELARNKFDITDNSRVLMIGDNVETDIFFGLNSGFKTCLLMSGATHEKDLESWRCSEKFRPDLILESVATIYEAIKDM